MRLILYGKPDCPLCDDLKRNLHSLQVEFGFTLDEHSIEEDADLYARFRYLIPVLDIPGGPLLYPPHDWQTLQRALAERQERPA